MKITFHGAARCVTGSKHVISLTDGARILLDCGMFQGMGPQTHQLNAHFGFDPSTISFLLLSHAHIDHSGLIPRLVKEGFEGRIYCTEATKELTEILLYDSAEIQPLVAEAMGFKGITIADPDHVQAGLQEAFQQEGPVLVNILTDPNALAMPPKAELKMIGGFALSMTKLMLTGRMDEIPDTVRSNYKHLKEIVD